MRTYLSTEHGRLHAVDDVGFEVRPGRTFGIVGESGSGKSMLIRSIAGLLPSRGIETFGSARIGGRPIGPGTSGTSEPVLGRFVSVVFQDPSAALNPVVRVRRHITEALHHRGLSRHDERRRARELLDMVGIPEPELRLRSYPHELSGGMRQRVCIAIAIACEPALVLADEPTTALDVTIQRQILDLLASLQRDSGMSMVLVSHDIGVVAGSSDDVGVMYGGQLVEQGPTRTLFRHARHPYTAALLSSTPRLDTPPHARLPVIAGSPGAVIDPGPGCRFASRCELAQVRCLHEDPSLEGSEHRFRCFYPLGTEAAEQAWAVNAAAGTTAAGLVVGSGVR